MSDAGAAAPVRSPWRRDRAVVLLGLVGVAALSWIGTILLSREMRPTHAGLVTPHGAAWTGGGIGMLVLMWTAMMAAMMVPVAAPCLLGVAGAKRENRQTPGAVSVAAQFLSGDLLVWTGFSLFAALAQWRLHAASLMSTTMPSTSSALSGALLVAVGLFQFTPMKKECLRRCRALPVSTSDGVRNRSRSAFFLGLEHGAFSVGSCGALMLVLLTTGVMSVPWMAALTGLLVLERINPRALWVSRTSGAFFAAWGGWILLASLA